MNTYWYVKHSPDAQPMDSEAHGRAQWLLPPGLISKIRPGHRIVLANWDDRARMGRVLAFAVCSGIISGRATVIWCPADTALKPLPQGTVHWQSKEFFGFADTVIYRYCLDDLFAEHLGEIEPIAREPRNRPNGLRTLPFRRMVAGHVYVLESPYGYKIGKTVNLMERTRLFAVKLPFQNSLVHHFQSDDYTAAERALHQQYADRRLEGEWFNLTVADLANIRRMHPQLPGGN